MPAAGFGSVGLPVVCAIQQLRCCSKQHGGAEALLASLPISSSCQLCVSPPHLSSSTVDCHPVQQAVTTPLLTPKGADAWPIYYTFHFDILCVRVLLSWAAMLWRDMRCHADAPEARESRFKVALQRYAPDPNDLADATPAAEQDRWEAEQQKRTRLGGGNREALAEAAAEQAAKYEMLFDDSIEFIKVGREEGGGHLSGLEVLAWCAVLRCG